MAREVGKAFKLAKIAKADGDGELYAFMTGTRNIGAKLSLVENLLKMDPEFKTGRWYASSKHSGGRNDRDFRKLVTRVENQTDGFLWASWQQVDD